MTLVLFGLFIIMLIATVVTSSRHTVMLISDRLRRSSTRRLLTHDASHAGMARGEQQRDGVLLTRPIKADGVRAEALLTQLKPGVQIPTWLVGIGSVTPHALVRVKLLQPEDAAPRPLEVSVSQLSHDRLVFPERARFIRAGGPETWEVPEVWQAGALTLDAHDRRRWDALNIALVWASVALGTEPVALRRLLDQRPAALLGLRVHARGVMALWALCADGDLRGQLHDAHSRARLVKQCIARVEAIWADRPTLDEAEAARQVALALYHSPHLSRPVRLRALEHLDAHEPEVCATLLAELFEQPSLAPVTLWWSHAPERLHQTLAAQPDPVESLHALVGAAIRATDDPPREAFAALAIAHQGLDALWRWTDQALATPLTRAWLDAPGDDTRRERVCEVVARLRTTGHPSLLGMLCGLASAGPALTALDPASASWLEAQVWSSELPAHPVLEFADAGGRILRFIGQGPSLSQLQTLYEHARFQEARRRMLSGHITLISDRLSSRARPGGLELVAAPEQAGGLSIADADAGALSMTPDAP